MESIKETVIRETKEETNYDIKIKKLLYLQEWIDKKKEKNVLYIIFLRQIIGGKETHLNDHSIEKEHIQAIGWKTVEELKAVAFHPKDILVMIEKDLKDGFKNNAIYLTSDIIE